MATARRDQVEKPGASVNAAPDVSGPMVPARTMPESLAAEAAVLGSMLIEPECIGDVVELLERDAFYRIEHRHIFDALISLYEKNKGVGIDAVLLRDELARNSRLEDAGGVEYIARILDSVPSAANVVYYAGVIRDKMLLRELISTAGSILDKAYEQTG
ncbi:MAG: DnaB-like helicase N-terminal domain-containing protein, partial [Planctomycetota bacterium]